MLEGRFEDATGAPYIDARVAIPRLSLRGSVSFLVDTGADGSVLMLADSRRLGINFGALRNPITSEGIGGTSKGFNEQVVLSFSDRRHIYSYVLDVEISAPSTHNPKFPSLLGRDIIDQWRFLMDRQKNKISFTPRKWDLRLEI
jgi:hypothetical protein